MLLLMLGAALFVATTGRAADYEAERAALLIELHEHVRWTAEQTGIASLPDAVAQALLQVPRHEFVPAERRSQAYQNRPLSIGYGQTISQPYIVALMTALLDLDADAKVLEIGTGSAYQAAILAEIASEVYTIEIIPQLGEQARRRLTALGYDNVKTRVGDGYHGWREAQPFDAIMVTAAASHIPPPLIAQLKPGGRLVIPVGGRFATQSLVLVEKSMDGAVTTRELLSVRFVPLTGSR